MSDDPSRRGMLLGGSGGAFGPYSWAAGAAAPATRTLRRLRNSRPRNILFVPTDDHRYDAMGVVRPGHEDLAERMSRKLFALLEKSDGMQILLSADTGERNELRGPTVPKGAPFPPCFFRTPVKK